MHSLLKSGVIVLTALISACGSGTAEIGSGNNSGGQGRLSLKITDAPIDNANKVVIEFVGVELRSSSLDEIINIDFAPKSIDLLALQGISTAVLLDNEPLPAGVYNELRLKINADDDGELESFIELSDGSQHELIIPSGFTSGLKIKGELSLSEDSTGNFTVDFDVRRSIVVAGGQGNSKVKYHLKPVLRLTEDTSTGNIRGLVHADLLTDSTCSDSDPVTDNAVYVFAGSVIPDDMDSSSDTDIEPLTSVLLDDTFNYTAAFLPAGEYTLAFTCRADIENVDTDDDLSFLAINNVLVVAGETRVVNLDP